MARIEDLSTPCLLLRREVLEANCGLCQTKILALFLTTQ